MHIRMKYISLNVCLLALFAWTPAGAQNTFRAAVVKVNITPDSPQWLAGYGPRQSTGVHDSLYHKILVMDDGTSEFVIVSSDVGVIPTSYYDDMSRRLTENTGIPPENFWWSTTHTHSGPVTGPPELIILMLPERYEKGNAPPNPEFSRTMQEQLYQGILRARSMLEPARLGVATGMSMANINRRAEDTDGTIRLGMNPDRPVDRQVGVIRIDRADGRPLAIISNYAIHGTALGSGNLEMSGDVPGIVAAYVEEKTGAPHLFINGAAGNVAPIYSGEPDFRRAHITQYNVLLGDKILAASNSIDHYTSHVTLRTARKFIETPLKPGFGWLENLNHYLRVTSAGDSLIRLPVSFLQINQDIAIWAAPIELFSQIAVHIRNNSPFPTTLYYGYTNGAFVYLPIASAFREGGYEAGRVTPFTPRAEQDITTGVLSQLRQMTGPR